MITSMTTSMITDASPSRFAATDRQAATGTRSEQRLRFTLGLNAATSAFAGLVGLLAASWTADLLGVEAVGVVRLVSLALVVFALDVALLERAGRRWLAPGALAVSVVDLAWVAATLVLVGRGVTDGAGTIVALVMGLGVLDFAVLQLWVRSRLAPHLLADAPAGPAR